MTTSNIERVTIGNEVEVLPWNFANGSKITTVAIPNSVTLIRGKAFANCYYLTSVTIPNSVTSIGDGAFSGCSGLTSIDIANSVTSIGNDAFRGCSGLISINVASDNTKYDSRDNCNAIIETASNTLIFGCKNTIIPNSVTSIGEYAFRDCSELTSINIHNSVTSIGGGAFYNCSGLTSVTIGNSVTTIGEYAFYKCSGLTDLVWNAWNCSSNGNMTTSNIERVTIGNEVEALPSYFVSGSKITTVDIPNSVTSIGWYAFSGCSGLTSIDIPNSVTSIGGGAFSGCSGLTSVTIGNSVTEIGYEAFRGCSGLTSIDIPNSVTSIGGGAFSGCSGLTSVTIGNSVTEIGYEAFRGCSGLTSINVASDNTKYDSRDNCNAIIETASNTLIFGCKNTIIPNSVTSIGEYAFRDCSELTSINIPNSVTSIGEYAFQDCSGLTSVTIPNSVTYIEFCAFRSCYALQDVFSYIIDPTAISMHEEVFPSDVFSNARTLHVPAGSLEAYQAEPDWSQYFGSIVEMEAVLATSVELDCESAELTEGETLQLTATVLPGDATDKTVTWASSDETVATVDGTGFVAAVAAGTATITATTNDGSDLSASCTVTVASPVVPVGDNILVMADTTVMHGDIIALPVAMTNDAALMAFQTDIFLPEGFTIVTDEDDEYIITPSERLSSDHVIMSDNANNGSVRVICYTPNSQPITGNEGGLFYIHVQIPDDAEGPYTINLRNTLLTTVDYTEISAPDTSAQIEVIQFIPGDVNDSRTVTVTDIVIAAQYILDRDPSPFIFEAADMNGDGNVTVTDIMLIAYLINHPTMNAPRRLPALMDCNDQMSGESVSLMAGETRTVSIVLDNEMDYTAFQMDLTLPEGLTAGNFQLTDRAGNHAFDVNAIAGNKMRALCYSPAIEVIDGHSGALLTFDVTANATVEGSITVDGIELVTTDCQSVLLNGFAIGVNATTSVNEIANGKTVARVDYFNVAGQRIDRPESGVTLIVTTYTDGTRTTTKVMK